MKLKKHYPFLISIFGGVLVWCFLFLIFPATIVYPFSKETFLFILSSYIALFLGYFLPLNFKKNIVIPKKINKNFIYFLIGLCLVCFLVRYIDLFLNRKVSFYNSVWVNRALLSETKPNFVFIAASIFKQIYFLPIVFILKEKFKDKKLVLISFLLFLLPFVEGYIRGSRNVFFSSIILLLFILLFFKKIKFNKKHIIIIIVTIIILFTAATAIIMNREANKTDNNYTSLTTDFFLNKFLQPKPVVFKTIQGLENQTLKKVYVSGFQIIQYYLHGVFEFDNLIKYYQKEEFKPLYGKYTFFTVIRVTNKYGISNTDLNAVELKNPRQITFITFFGGLYLDFGWLGIIIMFLFGNFQRFLANRSSQKTAYLPLFVFLLFCNFFMLTFNFIKSSGVHVLVVCLVVIFMVSLYPKFVREN